MTSADPNLVTKSLDVIAAGQTAEGAFLAAPTFPTYRYSWFRDGAFIAEAMDAWGRADSAAAFHAWSVSTLDRQLADLERWEPTQPLGQSAILHTRYLANGNPGSADWPNFQLDGFGTWLWAFARHVGRRDRPLDDVERRAVTGLARYLAGLWAAPNFDCWEEFPDSIHPSTLGAITAGLRGTADLTGDARWKGVAHAIDAYVVRHGTEDGAFVKHIGSSEVDANLLWLTTAYDILPPDHAVVRRTRERIRSELRTPEGGVKRYRADTYYGGGSWILLTAEFGCDALDAGDVGTARETLSWIEAQATAEGHLPEQVPERLNEPTMLRHWEDRWGPSACPLLWSHAAYLRLAKRLEKHV